MIEELENEEFLCAECFTERHHPMEVFDWSKVRMANMKCEKCGCCPIVFIYPKENLTNEVK